MQKTTPSVRMMLGIAEQMRWAAKCVEHGYRREAVATAKLILKYLDSDGP